MSDGGRKSRRKQRKQEKHKHSTKTSSVECSDISDRETQVECGNSGGKCQRQQAKQTARLFAHATLVAIEARVAAYLVAQWTPQNVVTFHAGVPGCLPECLGRGNPAARVQFLTCTSTSPAKVVLTNNPSTSSITPTSETTSSGSPIITNSGDVLSAIYDLNECSATPTQTLQLANSPVVRTNICLKMQVLNCGVDSDSNRNFEKVAQVVAEMGFNNLQPPSKTQNIQLPIGWESACYQLEVVNTSCFVMKNVHIELDSCSRKAMAGAKPIVFVPVTTKEEPQSDSDDEKEKQGHSDSDGLNKCETTTSQRHHPITKEILKQLKTSFTLCPGEKRFLYIDICAPCAAHVMPSFHVKANVKLDCGCERKLLRVTQANPDNLAVSDPCANPIPTNQQPTGFIVFPATGGQPFPSGISAHSLGSLPMPPPLCTYEPPSSSSDSESSESEEECSTCESSSSVSSASSSSCSDSETKETTIQYKISRKNKSKIKPKQSAMFGAAPLMSARVPLLQPQPPQQRQPERQKVPTRMMYKARAAAETPHTTGSMTPATPASRNQSTRITVTPVTRVTEASAPVTTTPVTTPAMTNALPSV